MKASSSALALVCVIFTTFLGANCIRTYPHGSINLLQRENELLAAQDATYGLSYSSSAQLTVDTICTSVMKIYSIFGNDTITPFDSCSYYDVLLGTSNSAYTESTPTCFQDVVDSFCTFQLLDDDDEILSKNLFDFVISSISYCVNDVSSSTLETTCPALDTTTQLVTDLEMFCTDLMQMNAVTVEDDWTLVSKDSANTDYRYVYKYVGETQRSLCMQIVEVYNYCVYVKTAMGATSVSDCYDKNFEMYDQLYVELYNTNMISVCGNIVVPTLIYYSGIADLTTASKSTNFCSSITDLNTEFIEERITNVTAVVTTNTATVTTLRTEIESLDELAEVLTNATNYITTVKTDFSTFYTTLTSNGIDEIDVTAAALLNINLLNTTLVQTSAYATLFKENITALEDDIVSNIDTITADIAVILNLLDTIDTLLVTINNQLEAGSTNTTTSSTSTVSWDDVLTIYDTFSKVAQASLTPITKLSVLVEEEVETLTEEITTLNTENLELTAYITNLSSQSEINTEIESYLS